MQTLSVIEICRQPMERFEQLELLEVTFNRKLQWDILISKGGSRQEYSPPENVEISYLLECYFLHFHEQLKTYFTKKSNYRYTNYLSLEERKMTILNTEKYFPFVQRINFTQRLWLSREQSVLARFTPQEWSLCVQQACLQTCKRSLWSAYLLHIRPR